MGNVSRAAAEYYKALRQAERATTPSVKEHYYAIAANWKRKMA